MVKGDNMPNPNIPESFNVLVRELQGLCLDVKID
jgi:DNA-directed RNA polymerase subunit beta